MLRLQRGVVLLFSARRLACCSVNAKRPAIISQAVCKKINLSARNEQIYFVQTLKRILSCRYLATHIYPDRAVTRECRPLLRSCLKKLIKSNLLSSKEKAFYSLSIAFPGLYWLYRVKADPDMWKWERAERRRRQEERKNRSV